MIQKMILKIPEEFQGAIDMTAFIMRDMSSGKYAVVLEGKFEDPMHKLRNAGL